MPDIANLTVKYGADTAGAEQGANKVNSLVSGMGAGVKGLLQVAGGTVLGTAISAVAGGVGKLAVSGLNFEEQMANVNSVLQDDSATKKYGQALIQLSQDPRILAGPTELAAGFYNVASAGFTGQGALDVMTQAAYASTAGMTTADVAASAIAGTMNAYGQETYTAQQVSDALFGAVAQGSLTFEQLASNLGNTTSLASQMGVGVNELASAYAVMSNNNISAAQAETQIAAVMRASANPTAALTETLQANGYATADAAIQAEGFGGYLKMVMDAAGGNKEALYDMLGTQEAVNAAMILGADGGSEYEKVLAQIDAGMEGVGATQLALAKQMDSANFKIKEARKQVEIAATVFTGMFAPAIGAVAGAFSKGLLATTKFFGTITKFHRMDGQGFGQWVRSLPGWLQPVARGFFQLINPIEDVVDAFQDLLRGDVRGFWNELKEAGEGFLNAIGNFKDDLEKNFKKAFSEVDWGAVWKTGTDLLKAAAGGIWDLGTTAINSAISFLGDLAGLAGRGYDWLQEKLGLPPNASFPSTVTALISTIADWAGDLVGAVGGRFKDWVAGKLGLGTMMGDGTGGPDPGGDISVGTVVKATISTVVEWLGDLKDAVVGGLGGLRGWINKKLGLGGSGLGSNLNPFGNAEGGDISIGATVKAAFNTVVSWLGDLKDAIGDALGWVKKKLGLDRPLPEIQQSVKAKFNTVANWLGDLADLAKGSGISDWLKKKLGIPPGGELSLGALSVKADSIKTDLLESSLGLKLKAIDWGKMFDFNIGQDFGEKLGERFGNWIENIDIAGAFYKGMVLNGKIYQGIAGAFLAVTGQAIAVVDGFFRGLLNSVNWDNIGSILKSKISDAWDGVKTTIDGKIQDMSDSVGKNLQGISDSFTTNLGKAKAAITDILAPVKSFARDITEAGTNIIDKFTSLGTSVTGFKDTVVNTLTGLGDGIFDTLSAAIDGLVEKISGIVGVYNTVAGVLGLPQVNLPGTSSGGGSGGSGGGGGSLGDAFDAVTQNFKDALQRDKPTPSAAGQEDHVPQIGKEPAIPTAAGNPRQVRERVPAPDTSAFSQGMGQLQTITKTQTAKVPSAFTQAIAPFLQQVRTQALAATKDWGAPTGLGGLVPITKTTGGNTVGAFQTAIQPMLPAAQDTGRGSVSLFGGGIAPITGTARDAGGGANSFFTDAIAPIVGNAGSAGTGSHGSFNSGLSPIVGTANKLGSSTSGQFSSTLAPIVPQSGAHGRNASSAFNTGISAVRQAIGIAQGAAGGVNNALASASSGAYSYGYSVGSQFAAGLSASASLVSAAAATIRSLMPSSPAKKGPLKEPISFAYIVDDLRRNMNQMRGVALGGVKDTADALHNPLGYSGVWARSGAAPAGAGDTYIIITVPTEEWQQVAADAKAGRLAHTQVSPRGRETALGLARG